MLRPRLRATLCNSDRSKTSAGSRSRKVARAQAVIQLSGDRKHPAGLDRQFPKESTGSLVHVGYQAAQADPTPRRPKGAGASP